MIVSGIALAQAVRESCCQLSQLGRTVLTEPDVLSVWTSGAEQSRVCRRIVNYSVLPIPGEGAVGDVRCEMGGSEEAGTCISRVDLVGGWLGGCSASLLGV